MKYDIETSKVCDTGSNYFVVVAVVGLAMIVAILLGWSLQVQEMSRIFCDVCCTPNGTIFKDIHGTLICDQCIKKWEGYSNDKT